MMNKYQNMFDFADITSAGAAENSAMIGVDFIPLTEISFESGNYQACASVTINQDATAEPTESFTLTIAPNQDNIAVGSPSVLTVSIVDDDGRFIYLGGYCTTYPILECFILYIQLVPIETLQFWDQNLG